MNTGVSLLTIIVVLCMGYVASRGFEENRKTVSFNIDVVRPLDDCLHLLGDNNNNNNNNTNNNTLKCEIDLSATERFTLENVLNTHYIMRIGIGSKRQPFRVFSQSIIIHYTFISTVETGYY